VDVGVQNAARMRERESLCRLPCPAVQGLPRRRVVEVVPQIFIQVAPFGQLQNNAGRIVFFAAVVFQDRRRVAPRREALVGLHFDGELGAGATGQERLAHFPRAAETIYGGRVSFAKELVICRRPCERGAKG
jgi:hypothetical protein